MKFEDVTDEEVKRVAKRWEEDWPKTWPKRIPSLEEQVRDLFGILKRVREGDPIGTVRESPDGTRAIKVDSKTPFCNVEWLVTETNKRGEFWRTPNEVKDWKIVLEGKY